jgi:uncharacterized protein
MSAHALDVLDFARAVQAGRVLEGREGLRGLPRLAAAVEGMPGEVEYRIEFGRQPFIGGYVRLQARAEVILQCQRSLESFSQSLLVDRFLAPVRNEQDEAGLPEDWEPLLLDEEGRVHPLQCLEDELLLALPDFPRKPEAEDAAQLQWQSDDEGAGGPFAALAKLRRN